VSQGHTEPQSLANMQIPAVEPIPVATTAPFLKAARIFPHDVLCGACQKALYQVDLNPREIPMVATAHVESMIVILIGTRATALCSKACLVTWVADQDEATLLRRTR